VSWFTGANADRPLFPARRNALWREHGPLCLPLAQGFRRDDHINYFLLLAAFTLHTVAMFKRGFSLQRCPVNNLYEATLFIAWTITAVYIVVGLMPRLRFVGAFASPLLFTMGVFALMPALDPRAAPRPHSSTVGSASTPALILLAFGAFGLASVAALMFLSLERDLKAHRVRAILSLLPPIQRLEIVAGSLVTAGFVLLTAGLSVYPLISTQDGQHFWFLGSHHPVVALCLGGLSVLLVMRWRGQGGRRFAWGALVTFTFVLLTFWAFISIHQATIRNTSSACPSLSLD